MSKKTLALIVGLIILTVILLVVALVPSLRQAPQKPSETAPGQPTATPTPPAYTTITLTPNPLTLSANGTGTIDVVVDTSQNSVTAVQLEISYDPEVLTNVKLTPGDFFPNPIALLNIVDEDNGRITYALGITPAQTPVQGQGVIAKVTFQRAPGQAAQSTQVDLLPKTLVTQQGIGPSVLKSTAGTTVILPAVTQTAPSPSVTQSTPVTTAPSQ